MPARGREQQANESSRVAADVPRFAGIPIKYLSFVCFVFQNVSVVMMLRYTRSTPREKQFLPSTAVISAEVTKFILSMAATYMTEGSLHSTYDKKYEALKTSVPALLYLVQNNLIYFAIARFCRIEIPKQMHNVLTP